MLQYLPSVIVSLCIGLLLGWIASIAIKSAARALGCLGAVLFILVQVLVYFGVVQWDWAAFLQQLWPVAGAATGVLELGWHVFAYNISLAVGMVIGLLYGIRH